ncbi:pyrimidine-nucleoside phosphorylase [Bacillus sp. SM2101]|uniref:pyrimidine-nucleoside phosphorylase n=1 Tax=Bacillus sp. SM2101 TaxID=2805366 RepID=UPI001BDE5AFC|nr:pyrimidine-nucleoside phosphorylase [Bacillus sp. SM2101]
MRMVDLIQKKKHGEVLTTEEIKFIVEGYGNGDIPDYQISSLCMAIYFKGMNEQEISDLTMAMVNSGDVVDLSAIEGVKVDKHSTGGVGDKISLIVAPLVAAVGVPVAKMSGRGLGHTGGTLDKLESIEGFQIELTSEQFIENVNNNKIAIVGQSANLAPVDKKLYALRDVTATVDSIPMIASSVMSKKIASGAESIVLDVKTGSGAFMKSTEDAKSLAQTMVDIGKNTGRKTVAVISDMNQPLGYEVGNANEIREAIEVLQGSRVDDLREIALTISSHMTVLGGIYQDFEEAFKSLEEVISSGKAIETLKRFIESQSGNSAVVDDTSKLPQAKYHKEIKATSSGYVSEINAELVGVSAMMLGAGRKKKDDVIDHSAGISLKKKVGDQINEGDTLCVFHSNIQDVTEAENTLLSAYTIIQEQVAKKTTYIHHVIA